MTNTCRRRLILLPVALCGWDMIGDVYVSNNVPNFTMHGVLAGIQMYEQRTTAIDVEVEKSGPTQTGAVINIILITDNKVTQRPLQK